MINVYVDLDGTLIFNQKRFESLLLDILKLKQNEVDIFLEYKKLGFSNIEILSKHFGRNKLDIEAFKSKWLERIEDKHFLKEDSLVDGAKEWLKNVPKNIELTLCTARQNRENLLWQLNYLDIACYFHRVIVTYGNPMKHSFIKEVVGEIDRRSWFIGDSVEDINSGKMLELRTCAVLTGYTLLDEIVNCAPDLILKKITDFDLSNLL